MCAPIDKRLDAVIENIGNSRTDIAECASLINASRTRRFEEFLKSHTELQAQESRAAKRRELLRSLTKVDFTFQHDKISRAKHPGTCNWLLRDFSFLAWISNRPAASFACFGIPGSGKSVLASHVVDDIRASHTSTKVAVCHHYCEYSDERTLELAGMFGSLTRQLLEKKDIPTNLEETISKHFVDGHGSSPQAATDLFHEALSLFDKVFVVIDGLDELKESDQSGIIRALKDLLRGEKVMLYISCRCEELNVRSAFEGGQCVDISSHRSSDDLEVYISESVRTRINSDIASERLVIQDCSLENEIVKTLKEKACEM